MMKIRVLSFPDSKVHGANMGPTWVLSAPDGPMSAPWTLLSRLIPLKVPISPHNLIFFGTSFHTRSKRTESIVLQWMIRLFFLVSVSVFLLGINSLLHEIRDLTELFHYKDIIMSAMASQITSLTTVYSTVYSGADQRKHQRSASLAFVRGVHRWPVNSLHKGPVMRKMLPFDDVIMSRVKLGACHYVS